MSIGSQANALQYLEDRARPLGYDEAKTYVTNRDTRVRRLLAARRDAPHEVLYYLATDESAAVRRAVAANIETPIQAELILCRDKDEEVRVALAEKVAIVAKERSADDQPGRVKLFFDLLKALARDELARIRRVVSRAIKDIANIPRDIVHMLARDPDPEVATPVLKDSPVLHDRDLIAVIEDNPTTPVVSAVARRATVGERLSDAVIATGNEMGIADLLANGSAQIREETLDRLIERAAEVPGWHAPLVKRPKLSPRAATRLAQLVPGTLAEALAARGDLDPKTINEIEEVVSSRSKPQAAAAPRAAPSHVQDDGSVLLVDRPHRAAAEESESDTAFERAAAMHAAGTLDEEAVSAAITTRDRPFVVASLALKANLAPPIVAKVMTLGSAKGITALVWKAGFSMRLATQLQTRLAGISPSKALYAKDGVGFPLSEGDMLWHLEFFGAA